MEIRKRTVDIRGMQNAERDLSELIKEEEYSKIIGASLEGTKLTLVFEVDGNGKKVRAYVKQISKKKYARVDDFFLRYSNVNHPVAVVETPKYWLLFSNKNLK